MSKRKMLFMGNSESGKTSIKTLIFSNMKAEDTTNLAPTMEVEKSHFKLFPDSIIHVWDCGGEKMYLNNFFGEDLVETFSNVDVLMFVAVLNGPDRGNDLKLYESCIEAICKHSPAAHVFCCLHKKDLTPRNNHDHFFAIQKKEFMNKSKNVNCFFYMTSIHDNSLYYAWASMAKLFFTHINDIEIDFQNLAEILGCDEIILFDNSTFVIIAHYQYNKYDDPQHFEKVLFTIKDFKDTCKESNHKLDCMEVSNASFLASAYFFTSTELVMAVTLTRRRSTIKLDANLIYARNYFERLHDIFYKGKDVNIHSCVVKSSTTTSSTSTTTSTSTMRRPQWYDHQY